MKIIDTLILLFTIITIKHFITIPFIQPIIINLTITIINISLNNTTKYTINPTKNLSPKIIHQIIKISNKKNSN